MRLSRKQQEVTELLRREISRIILYELSDPRMGFITITRLKLGGDYRSAKVFVTVRGSRADVGKTLDALAHARGHIQALVGERLKLRYTPVLEFVKDVELGKALRVDRLIEELKSRPEGPGARGDFGPDQEPSQP